MCITREFIDINPSEDNSMNRRNVLLATIQRVRHTTSCIVGG